MGGAKIGNLPWLIIENILDRSFMGFALLIGIHSILRMHSFCRKYALLAHVELVQCKSNAGLV